MSFGDTDHYRELFLELETTPHRGSLNPAQIQLLTNALKTRWNGLSEFRRNERGRAIQNFHEALKDKSDAQRQLAYVEKYRGAPNDNGSDIWRPRFGLYEEKLRKLVRVLRNVDLRCGQLWRLRERERQGDPVGTWLRDLLDAARTEADGIDDWMRRELSTLREKAEKRVRALEEASDDSDDDLEIAEEDIAADEGQSDPADDEDESEGEGSDSRRSKYCASFNKPTATNIVAQPGTAHCILVAEATVQHISGFKLTKGLTRSPTVWCVKKRISPRFGIILISGQMERLV